MNLKTLGFNTFFIKQWESLKEEKYQNKIIGRIILEHKNSYRVLTEQGEWLATISGSYAFQSFSRADYPAVGDFVLVEQMPGEERAIIHHLFDRSSKFVRKIAGREVEEQIVAANVDLILLVMSLNTDFNLRRLERYLIAAWDSGATPVIVLTKADLCDEVEEYVRKVEQIAFGVDIFVISAVTGEGLSEMLAILTDGITAAILGSSGAGKSTLTNALLNEEQMKISSIREDDEKGRHTTTHRELVVLPTGACLIDTPGMRELQLLDQSDSLHAGFADIDNFAANCRFRDCTHKKEPHCAVVMAIEEGALTQDRLNSYFKLQKEMAFMEQKKDIAAKLTEKRKWKQISKSVKKKNS